MEQTDLELVRLARKGGHEAFHELVDRHAAPLFRLAATLVPTHSDAEDIVQETFTAAFRSLKAFQERSSVKTWFYAILYRQAALFHRKNRTSLRLLPDEESAAPGTAGPSGHAAAIDARLDVQAAMAQLPADQRAILVLREFDGLSYEEIASVLQLPRGTVESRLFRARQALKEWLSSRQRPE